MAKVMLELVIQPPSDAISVFDVVFRMLCLSTVHFISALGFEFSVVHVINTFSFAFASVGPVILTPLGATEKEK